MAEREDKMIRAVCLRYVCRFCRTKTGWPHQRWCGLAAVTLPLCADCRYGRTGESGCAYPALRKGGEAAHEKAEYSL